MQEAKNLKYNVDIDGIFACFDMFDLRASFKGIQINVDFNAFWKENPHLKPNQQPYIGTDGYTVDLSKLQRILFGTIDSEMGVLRVYLMLNLEVKLLKLGERIFELMLRLIKTENLINYSFLQIDMAKKKILGSLHYEKFNLFYEGLKNEFIGCTPLMFFQSFGGKSKSNNSGTDTRKLLEKIQNIFGVDKATEIYLDLCVSVSADLHGLTVPNAVFYETLQCKPTHTPLFNNCIKNLHTKTYNYIKKKQTGLGESYNCIKINFYSPFRAYLKSLKTKETELEFSKGCTLTKISGVSLGIKENRVNVLLEKYTIAADNPEMSPEIPFRLEFRVKYHDVSELMIKIQDSLLKSKHFVFSNSAIFITQVEKNISEFAQGIACGFNTASNYNFDSLVATIIAEHVFLYMYVMGYSSPTYLSESIREMISEDIQNSDTLDRLEIDLSFFETVALFLSARQRYEVIMNFIKYFRGFEELEKKLFEKVANFFFFDCNNLPELLLDCYCIESTKNINVTSQILSTKPKNRLELSLEDELKNAFLKPITVKKSTFAQFLFKIASANSDHDLINEVIHYFKEVNYVSIFKRVGDSKSKLELVFAKNNKDKKILEGLKQTFKGNNFPLTNKIKPDYNESARFFSANLHYFDKPKRVDNILMDSVYGFFPVRNANWISNKIRQLSFIFQSKEFFVNFIDDVYNWRPSDFELKDRLDHFARFGITFNAATSELYKKINDLDESHWEKIKVAKNYKAIYLEFFFNISKFMQYRSLIDEWVVSEQSALSCRTLSEEIYDGNAVMDSDNCAILPSDYILRKVPKIFVGEIEFLRAEDNVGLLLDSNGLQSSVQINNKTLQDVLETPKTFKLGKCLQTPIFCNSKRWCGGRMETPIMVESKDLSEDDFYNQGAVKSANNEQQHDEEVDYGNLFQNENIGVVNNECSLGEYDICASEVSNDSCTENIKDVHLKTREFDGNSENTTSVSSENHFNLNNNDNYDFEYNNYSGFEDSIETIENYSSIQSYDGIQNEINSVGSVSLDQACGNELSSFGNRMVLGVMGTDINTKNVNSLPSLQCGKGVTPFGDVFYKNSAAGSKEATLLNFLDEEAREKLVKMPSREPHNEMIIYLSATPESKADSMRIDDGLFKEQTFSLNVLDNINGKSEKGSNLKIEVCTDSIFSNKMRATEQVFNNFKPTKSDSFLLHSFVPESSHSDLLTIAESGASNLSNIFGEGTKLMQKEEDQKNVDLDLTDGSIVLHPNMHVKRIFGKYAFNLHLDDVELGLKQPSTDDDNKSVKDEILKHETATSVSAETLNYAMIRLNEKFEEVEFSIGQARKVLSWKGKRIPAFNCQLIFKCLSSGGFLKINESNRKKPWYSLSTEKDSFLKKVEQEKLSVRLDQWFAYPAHFYSWEATQKLFSGRGRILKVDFEIQLLSLVEKGFLGYTTIKGQRLYYIIKS